MYEYIQPILSALTYWYELLGFKGVIAVAAFVVSLFALGYSRRSSKSAKESVRQITAVRHRDDAPQFSLSTGDGVSDPCRVVVTYVSGPPKIVVTAEYKAEMTGASFDIPLGGGEIGGFHVVDRSDGVGPVDKELVKNGSFKVSIETPPSADRATITLTLRSREVGGDNRLWEYAEVVVWETVPKLGKDKRIILGWRPGMKLDDLE